VSANVAATFQSAQRETRYDALQGSEQGEKLEKNARGAAGRILESYFSFVVSKAVRSLPRPFLPSYAKYAHNPLGRQYLVLTAQVEGGFSSGSSDMQIPCRFVA